MAAPPPFEGPCKECNRENTPAAEVPTHGQYRGICVDCRPAIAEQRRIAREERASGAGEGGAGDGDGRDDSRRLEPAKRQPKLKDACLYLARKAETLDKALDKKKIAHREAQAALSSFKEQLTLVSRVAQSMLNTSTQSRDDEP